MNENLTKTCRICLTEGSRNIFQRTVTHDALYNVSSLNRISEKLRYVTLLKIDEMENLPPMICDLCIVQLNVAYNFKRQATESDTKLRQYLIENGIDIMKDPLALPALTNTTTTIGAPPAITNPPTTTSILRPAITAPSRTIQRSNSTASSTVLEIPASVLRKGGPPAVAQLRPIRIKVETPETTTEQSSDGGDLLSNSEISPLSTATLNPVIPSAEQQNKTVVALDSSPASSKTSTESERAMVVLSSENVSLQGDEDFVQNILGSNNSIAANSSTEKVTVESDKPANDKEATVTRDNEPTTEKIAETGRKKDRMKTLMAKLSINMVNSVKFPKSKHRTKPKKQTQKNYGTRLGNGQSTTPMKDQKSSEGKRRRHSLDVSQLQAKRAKINDSVKNSVARRDANVISANKLRSLREKIREEKESGVRKDKTGVTNDDGVSRTSLP